MIPVLVAAVVNLKSVVWINDHVVRMFANIYNETQLRRSDSLVKTPGKRCTSSVRTTL